ncbi:hypothetical protein K1Y38_28015 [Serratia marcescens]|nr:hypothetical protein [Serratia marcescens]
MIKLIKKRPLCLYYFWKVCQRFERDESQEFILPPVKAVIGQLQSERRNLEKVENESIAIHISSLALLEEILKNDLNNHSESSFRISKNSEKVIDVMKENGVWACPSLKTKRGNSKIVDFRDFLLFFFS